MLSCLEERKAPAKIMRGSRSPRAKVSLLSKLMGTCIPRSKTKSNEIGKIKEYQIHKLERICVLNIFMSLQSDLSIIYYNLLKTTNFTLCDD